LSYGCLSVRLRPFSESDVRSYKLGGQTATSLEVERFNSEIAEGADAVIALEQDGAPGFFAAG